MLGKKLNSLKKIAEYLRKKATEIEETYLLNSIKLLKAADILDPIKENANKS